MTTNPESRPKSELPEYGLNLTSRCGERRDWCQSRSKTRASWSTNLRLVRASALPYSQLINSWWATRLVSITFCSKTRASWSKNLRLCESFLTALFHNSQEQPLGCGDLVSQGLIHSSGVGNQFPCLFRNLSRLLGNGRRTRVLAIVCRWLL